MSRTVDEREWGKWAEMKEKKDIKQKCNA